MEETDAPGAVLATLRSLGVRIVLDDFGTGYSSLSYLRRFPLDGLKLDRAFVDGLGACPTPPPWSRRSSRWARRSACVVTAEGIETREHAERLRELGCPLGQGYVLARPLPAAEAAAVLADRLRRAPRQRGPRASANRSQRVLEPRAPARAQWWGHLPTPTKERACADPPSSGRRRWPPWPPVRWR